MTSDLQALTAEPLLARLRRKASAYLDLLPELMDWLVGRGADRFVIVTYHLILTEENPYYPWGIPLPDFEQQLRVFHRTCSVLSLDEIVQRLERGSPLPARCLALTFDDGYRDLYTVAAPRLRRYGLPASVFIALDAVERGWLWPDLLRHAIRETARPHVELETLPDAPRAFELSSLSTRLQAAEELSRRLKAMSNDRKWIVLQELVWKLLGVQPEGVGNPGLMLSWEQLEALSRDGFEIGAHTVTHPILSRLPEDEAAREITGSRRRLQERLGVSVEHFAYPNGTWGDFSPVVEELVRQAGFRTASTTVPGVNRGRQDSFRLRRFDGVEEVVRDLVAVLGADLTA